MGAADIERPSSPAMAGTGVSGMRDRTRIRMWAAVAAMAWVALPAPASATDSYLYCKGYSQGCNVITPIIVDSPSVGQQWDAYLKSGGFSGGGCRSSFKERDVVAQMRDDLMQPPLSFQPIQWTPRPFQQTSNQTVAIPNPVLLPIAIEQYTESGKQFIRYHFDVTNKTSYPAELFRASPDLPPAERISARPGLGSNSSTRLRSAFTVIARQAHPGIFVRYRSRGRRG